MWHFSSTKALLCDVVHTLLQYCGHAILNVVVLLITWAGSISKTLISRHHLTNFRSYDIFLIISARKCAKCSESCSAFEINALHLNQYIAKVWIIWAKRKLASMFPCPSFCFLHSSEIIILHPKFSTVFHVAFIYRTTYALVLMIMLSS